MADNTHNHAALITLGSNIDPEANLAGALARLRDQPHLRLVAVSPIYETAPQGGPPGQPPFLNAAVAVTTDLAIAALKRLLLSLEAQLGRVRSADKFAPRTIDLDIALYDQEVIACNGIRIPDPDIVRYPHVALPLADIAPERVHPELGCTLRQIAANLRYTTEEIRQR